jgi:hypothetical protein
MAQTGGNPHEQARLASLALREAGVPGIKYRDGDANNYVVFDDKLVNVKRKYADGGVVNG